MFKVELEFNNESIGQEIDSIFSNKNMPCIKKSNSCRIYEDNKNTVTLGTVGIILEEIQENENVKKSLTKAIGTFEGETADLLADYIRE